MTTHSSILAWNIPWTEGPRKLQSMGSQRVGHDWAHTHSIIQRRRKYTENLYHVLMKTITSQPTRRKPMAHRSLWITYFEDPWSVVEASELWEDLRLLGGSLQPREVGMSSFQPHFKQSISPFIRLMHNIVLQNGSQDWCRVLESLIQGYICVFSLDLTYSWYPIIHKYRNPELTI